MKTTGKIWKAYLASWPEGQWFDDSDETADGKEDFGDEIADDAVVVFTCGTVFAGENDKDGKSLTRHFSAWLKSLNVAYIACEVPKEKADELRAFVKSLGGKAA